jgi:hypothetical protein
MDKESFERLVAGKPEDVQLKAALLYNGIVIGSKAYKAAPTQANLRDWEAAEAAFKKFTAEIGGPLEGETLSNLSEVQDYLVSAGWKTSKTGLHRHHKEGKISPQDDGTYRIKDVNKYARTFLKQVSTGRRLTERLDQLQTQKLELELKNLNLENRRKERLEERDKENIIPLEQATREECAKFSSIQADLDHLVMSNVAGWIRLVSGDVTKAGDLINEILHGIDASFTKSGNDQDLMVNLDPREEEEEPEI